MKNFVKARIVPLFGIMALVTVIGFSMLACSDDGGGGAAFSVSSTDGTVTISGFSSDCYGKWVYGYGASSNWLVEVYAASSISSNTVTAGQISDTGSVTLKVWKETDYDYNTGKVTLGDYSGSDTINFEFLVYNTANITENNYLSQAYGYGESTITFSSGSGSGTVGTIWTDIFD